MERVIFLGASNLTRGLATAVAVTRTILGGPVQVLAALGHGRSYGTWSNTLGRGLPGIVSCGLWDAFSGRSLPRSLTSVRAVLTDVGNDIVYGYAPEEIAGWVGRCLERLDQAGARIILTRLPIESVAALPPFRFEVLRRVMFPGRKIARTVIISRVRELDERLREIAVRVGATVVDVKSDWYGIDGIHIRLARWTQAWREILGSWHPGEPGEGGMALAGSCRAFSLLRWGELRGLRPENWSLFGVPRCRRQPCRVLPDGTSLSLF